MVVISKRVAQYLNSSNWRNVSPRHMGNHLLTDNRWNSVHKFEPLVFELLGVYIPVLTLLSFPCSFMVVLKPKKWIKH